MLCYDHPAPSLIVLESVILLEPPPPGIAASLDPTSKDSTRHLCLLVGHYEPR